MMLTGMLEGELTGADPVRTLRDANDRGICLSGVEWQDALTVTFYIHPGDWKTLDALCGKRGDRLKILRKQGISWRILDLIQRPLLIFGLAGLFFLTAWLPSKVLFLSVEGNEMVPARMILEAAEECGIGFGASRREVRSEKMKNALLEALPQLEWAGINTSGCKAVISVRERKPEGKPEQSHPIAHIVACTDGFITSCTATRGNLLCAPGQVVREGQLLISGYTDCGLSIRAEMAEGEVYAQTCQEITAVTPAVRQQQTEPVTRKRQISVILGKKRINFWKDSGIWDGTCDRMYEEYYITLPGGFRLPVALAVETTTQWKTVAKEIPQAAAEAGLEAFSQKQIQQRMCSGQILSSESEGERLVQLYQLRSRYRCEEMIGRVITQEIGETNGKTD